MFKQDDLPKDIMRIGFDYYLSKNQIRALKFYYQLEDEKSPKVVLDDLTMYLTEYLKNKIDEIEADYYKANSTLEDFMGIITESGKNEITN